VDHAEIEAEHERLLAGEPSSPSRLVGLLLKPLISFVERAVPSIVDPHEIEESCLDALLEYLRAPQVYDPARARLFTWLAGNARWEALTRLRSIKRQTARDQKLITRVQDEQFAVDKSMEAHILDVIEIHQILESHANEIVQEKGDLDIFLLVAAGARDTADYLDALGLNDTPANRMSAVAHREKIRGRIRRLRERLNEE
jgi:RNA polymerase sigma-70 factor (ECF subfamily)